jgi:uncharacterized protein (DUF2235 family)
MVGDIKPYLFLVRQPKYYRDTVSSVGIFRAPDLPGTATGMGHVCKFRHALALDEQRVKFLPEYIRSGGGPKDEDEHAKEVWFAGSHADV